MDYNLYVCDTETTGLDFIKNDVIELSLIRLSDGVQKTWSIKPTNFDTIESGALKINGHKLEDITHQTADGRAKYIPSSQATIEIENWLLEDGFPTEKRMLVGHNINFDKNMIEQLWKKCDSFDSFPFGRRMLDTMQIELFLDFCSQSTAEGYSLKNLIKKYGVKNEKAHTAASDTLATKEVFLKQVDFFKDKLCK